ncbi:guanylate cyclase 32E-like [Argiope bruennichi]|uniref:guanylate cyclase 32E-like n=1 Tax=Argiope bruennichi TaxID=94029 RepID=UPI002494F0DC|nr:guanylate cyclase 32E-like [Argiope bruennichi]
MASGFNLPMISYFCANPEVSDVKLFPTFARTRPSNTLISRSVASLLLTFGWMKVSFLYSIDPDSTFKEISRTIVSALDDVGIQIKFLGTWSYIYHHGYGENPFDKLVEQSYQESRIYVILGHNFEYLGMMMSLQRRGLLDKGEYFVVGVDIEQYENQNPMKYLKGLLKDEIEEDAKKAFQSYLGVVASPPIGFEDFATKVNKYMQLPPFNFPNPVSSFGGMKKVPAEGAYLYDAVYVYARALNECLINKEDPYDGRGMMKYIFGRTYFSAMGYMTYMDENGDAEGNYTLISRQKVPEYPGEYGLYPVGVFQLPENKSALPNLKFLADIEWVGNGPPADEPVCGFHGKKCVMWKVAIFVSGVTAAVLLLALLVTYKNWAYEQELDSLLWKIDYKDIQINEHTPSTNANRVSKNVHPLIRTSQVSLSSNVEGDFRYTTIFTTVGIYKGRMLAVKRFKKKSIDITRKMKKELKVMRDLRHDNLNPFVGACVEPPNIIIITEYCSRGSLRDILENEDVKLDNMFNASIIGDIVRGMTYLHESPLRSHGNLKSSNCLVDSRWVVKISDFGLHELKFGADTGDNEMDFEKQCEKLLWKAPELLRDPCSPANGTQKGDIYSFGIILYEIISRKGPYGHISMTPSEIIKCVIRKDHDPPFRPKVAKLCGSFDCVISCMQECWAEQPESRPDFKTINAKLRPMRRGMKPNIFDNMLAMMEKYANNLEALVDERTDQLNEEKRKTDALLYEMLPKYVADQLKKGHKVEAESFDSVTIYFSDIVGFTKMAAQCSPLEVVDFLNDLYTCFDSIIENYDVYKVETIGDAYMVVSGLPIPNGDKHAGEIASMALHLLEAIKMFSLRHKPEETLMLRIGIHSGAVCAGVVGRKMPRYCLFGDTVNTASRMESTGLPLRVHCSESCRNLLEKLGGYVLEERGLINIKGKGDMKTFWLTGQIDSYRIKKLQEQEMPPKSNSNQPVTRSSLKQPNKLASSKSICRRLSLDSPKNL